MNYKTRIHCYIMWWLKETANIFYHRSIFFNRRINNANLQNIITSYWFQKERVRCSQWHDWCDTVVIISMVIKNRRIDTSRIAVDISIFAVKKPTWMAHSATFLFFNGSEKALFKPGKLSNESRCFFSMVFNGTKTGSSVAQWEIKRKKQKERGKGREEWRK